jgi:hypothetical protein
MSEIKLKLILNKGRHGIMMNKLARIADEADKFVQSFAEDLKLDKSEWVADSFKNGSVIFTTNYVGTAELNQITKARNALFILIDPKVKASDLNGDLSRKTYAQFAKIASSIDADDSIGIGVYDSVKGKFVTKAFTKERAILIEREMNQTVEEFTGFQGAITALHKERKTCWLKDSISGNRIVCEYKPSQYTTVWKLLEKQDALADVEGWAVYKNGILDTVKIEHISSSAEYEKGDIDKFFGCSPTFTGGVSTIEYIDGIRGDE